ncbi:hypothetical protein E2C01_085006 [Portunus trituberculatus]|uniref:Uncharacterized protein n=1 Tax=Portunus trituberculatus TaxID=210409 RepID=A0A5B7J5L9_PORTR|nr:hypothetical protein [Portunus trituberculatus]
MNLCPIKPRSALRKWLVNDTSQKEFAYVTLYHKNQNKHTVGDLDLDMGKLHCALYNVMLLLLEVSYTFIQVKLDLSFSIVILNRSKNKL